MTKPVVWSGTHDKDNSFSVVRDRFRCCDMLARRIVVTIERPLKVQLLLIFTCKSCVQEII